MTQQILKVADKPFDRRVVKQVLIVFPRADKSFVNQIHDQCQIKLGGARIHAPGTNRSPLPLDAECKGELFNTSKT